MIVTLVEAVASPPLALFSFVSLFRLPMALNPSPRKTVPLATGDELRPRDLSLPAITKRVFYCGVVVEGSEHGRRLPDGELYRPRTATA